MGSATWHPTLCCAACGSSRGKCHGPKCERKLVVSIHDMETPMVSESQNVAPSAPMEHEMDAPMENDIMLDAPQDNEHQAACTSSLPETAVHLKFPVVVGDGRKLTIEWECGTDPQQVALAFAQAHGIHPDELPTIEAFVEHAESLARMESQGTSQD